MNKKMEALHRKNVFGEGLLDIINYVVLISFMIISIYPFYYIFIYSISDASEAIKGVYILPAKLDLISYVTLFKRNDLINAFFVSVLRTVLSTILSIFCCSFFAYLVTKKEMIFRKFSYRIVIITMYMNAGLIPWYITMKAYGLKNNFLLYIIPGAVNAFYIILIKTFIEQLPISLEESADLDGAGVFTKFFKIIIPLSKPIIATVAVYSAVGAWNSWMDNYLLVRSPKLQTIQLVLYNYLNEAQSVADSMRSGLVSNGNGNMKAAISPESVRMAITVISIAPIMLVYPFLQRYFIKGIIVGAIKG